MAPPVMVAAAQASLPAAAVPFAPPDGRRWRCVTVERRDDGAVVSTFTVERDLVFHHDPAGGWRAEVTLVRRHASAPAPAARRFEAALAPLLGRIVRVRLDAAGGVTAVADEDALWAALAAREPMLAALPPERRRAMLAAALRQVIAEPGLPAAGRPARAVTLPGDRLGAADGALPGEQRLVRDDGGLLVETVTAGGPAGDRRVSVRRTRRVDATTGLVLRQEQETLSGPGDGAGPGQRASTVTTLAPVP